MLKTIIGKLERKRLKKKKKTQKLERIQLFFFFFPSFKLKRFTQNSKTELKRLWVGLDSGTK